MMLPPLTNSFLIQNMDYVFGKLCLFEDRKWLQINCYIIMLFLSRFAVFRDRFSFSAQPNTSSAFAPQLFFVISLLPGQYSSCMTNYQAESIKLGCIYDLCPKPHSSIGYLQFYFYKTKLFNLFLWLQSNSLTRVE